MSAPRFDPETEQKIRRARLTPEAERRLRAALDTWGTDPYGALDAAMDGKDTAEFILVDGKAYRIDDDETGS